MNVYNIFCYWTYRQVDRGSNLFLLLSCISCYATFKICQSMSDTTIIFFFCLFVFLWGCMIRGPLEIHEMNGLINKPIVNITLSCIGLFILEIILLLTRFYFCSMPTYVAVVLFSHLILEIKFCEGSYLVLSATTR
jgi:hypothetical protein